MPSLLIILFVLFLSIIGNSVTIPKVSHERDALRSKEGVGFLLPPLIAKIVALEYKGLLSDAIFSRAHTFYGGKLIRNEALSEKEWSWIFNSLDLSTDLDPYFLDPYYFGATTLAWDADKVTEADMLLEKAMRRRTWDWTIPFYLGFNHFYFLRNNEKASEYLMEAARRPGGLMGFAPTLAARLSYKGRQTENSIFFLEEILRKTDDEKTRYIYELRLNALKKILHLEKASDFYKKKFGRYPKNLNQLVATKVIKEIPQDPYGGKFYIEGDGTIKITSDLKVMW
jgi:tetratricopeptide (TPR) repeat protein